MKPFFGEDLLLNSESAKKLYNEVKELPIIDFHCHLNEHDIQNDRTFDNLTSLWLAEDHYKWRVMRLCGVEERFITGNASEKEKFLAFAGCMKKMAGNPVYYWCQMELKTVFGIEKPLNEQNAQEIYDEVSQKIKSLSAKKLLKRFRVEFIATTNDILDDLEAQGQFDHTKITPTFRPDKLLSFDRTYLRNMEEKLGVIIDTLPKLKEVVADRLQFFIEKGCRLSDHGMDFLPKIEVSDDEAELIFQKDEWDDLDRKELFSNMLDYLGKLYCENHIVMQLHIGTFRNVNTKMYDLLGADCGFDVFRAKVDTDALATFLDRLCKKNALPKTLLYSLNPSAIPAMATISGAFPDVFVSCAWWFNDTVYGIKEHLRTVSEYASLGRNLGMLTDGRSFTGYVRFDFFRRILADTVGAFVENGEFDFESAKSLMKDICYNNIKELLSL